MLCAKSQYSCALYYCNVCIVLCLFWTYLFVIVGAEWINGLILSK